MTFEEAVESVLGHEGGYVSNPADPGGETKWGISKRRYPDLDIANLTREQAIAIYRRDYWIGCGCDVLPESVRDEVFDAAVLHKPDDVARFLQRALDVADDGHIGPVTRAAIAKAEPDRLIALFEAERLLFLTKLTTWSSFGRGWARRVAQETIDGMHELAEEEAT